MIKNGCLVYENGGQKSVVHPTGLKAFSKGRRLDEGESKNALQPYALISK